MFNNENHTWAIRFRSREMQALEEAIDIFGPSVQALVRRVLSGAGSSEDVEECVSDVFWAAWHDIESYDENRASFRTWLLVLTKYKALDLRRKLIRRCDEITMLGEVAEIRSPYSTEYHVISRESSRELIGFVRGMSEPDRSLFWRRYFYYESLDELAALFDLSKKAIESRLYRCRLALKQKLGLTETETKTETKEALNNGK
ncbi:sigma-70 family RNA polymerase sigma factor [Paenibacillus sp. 19GGS1-52]|uniref:sigma-70 family RNA polymerase sigma factor n=1 Tax=Paenibacillus sp. 19GGS1-52 TaxID=2758563 RepID=UPI001EFBFA6B|nr:sigma-70 family RNA polymerase sigma factor [Paenibacillus sp. 19GGS1-52]ULO05095.1 sigma-70 family RNA polymerase sigma factor [Paenibacillus sp. 19GGS1-52]